MVVVSANSSMERMEPDRIHLAHLHHKQQIVVQLLDVYHQDRAQVRFRQAIVEALQMVRQLVKINQFVAVDMIQQGM